MKNWQFQPKETSSCNPEGQADAPSDVHLLIQIAERASKGFQIKKQNTWCWLRLHSATRVRYPTQPQRKQHKKIKEKWWNKHSGNESTASGRRDAPLLKRSQWDMKLREGRKKTAAHMPDNRDVPSGIKRQLSHMFTQPTVCDESSALSERQQPERSTCVYTGCAQVQNWASPAFSATGSRVLSCVGKQKEINLRKTETGRLWVESGGGAQSASTAGWSR